MNAEEFISRWGETVFDCNFCGAEGMRWLEVAKDKWKPFDLQNDELHECPVIAENTFTRDFVLEQLHNLGFEAYRPRTNSWEYAFTASNKAHSLYFLVGKRGIDFKYYDSIRETKTDERGRLYTDGGTMVRNYYKDSEVNIHRLILEIASRFITNSPIGEDLLSSHGTSWKEQKAAYIKSLPQTVNEEARNEMKDIYDAISNDDGEDVYLSDGIWLGSNGSTSDRGR